MAGRPRKKIIGQTFPIFRVEYKPWWAENVKETYVAANDFGHAQRITEDIERVKLEDIISITRTKSKVIVHHPGL